MSSNIDNLQEIDFYIRKTSNIKTITTFETREMREEKPEEIRNIRKLKKRAFNHHSGKLKISTIHSFKGYEEKSVFLIIDESDNEEMIYTAISRSKFNIMIFTLEDSKYNYFFYKYLKEYIKT